MKKQFLFYFKIVFLAILVSACKKKPKFSPTEIENIESDIQMLKGLEVSYGRLLNKHRVAKNKVGFTVDKIYEEDRNIYHLKEDGTILKKYPADSSVRVGDGVMYLDKDKNLTHFKIKHLEEKSDSLYLDSIAHLLIKYNVRFINTRSYYGNFTVISTPKRGIFLHPPNDFKALGEDWKTRTQKATPLNDSTLIYIKEPSS